MTSLPSVFIPFPAPTMRRSLPSVNWGLTLGVAFSLGFWALAYFATLTLCNGAR